jgi:TM2 domain-containing membrane protein YozV
MSTAPDHPDSFRIGTAEREDAVRLLGDHYSEGRLTGDEYETRVSAAYAAENRAGLRPLFDDLPAPRPACLLPPPEPFYPAPPAESFYPPPLSPLGPPPPVQPYQPPTQQYPQPYQSYAQPSPYFPQQMSDKSKVTAGLLQIFLPFGIGRFYTGHVGIAVAQLLLCFACGAGVLWSWIDGIILLASGGTDATGRRLLN